jgi:hypothetical protein
MAAIAAARDASSRSGEARALPSDMVKRHIVCFLSEDGLVACTLRV